MQNRKTLELKLSSLKAELHNREALMSDWVQQIYSNLQNPVPYIKTTVKELAVDSDFRRHLLEIGLKGVLKYFMHKQTESSDNMNPMIAKILNKLNGANDKSNIMKLLKSIFAGKNDNH
jgi:hypothetical protein